MTSLESNLYPEFRNIVYRIHYMARTIGTSASVFSLLFSQLPPVGFLCVITHRHFLFLYFFYFFDVNKRDRESGTERGNTSAEGTVDEIGYAERKED